MLEGVRCLRSCKVALEALEAAINVRHVLKVLEVVFYMLELMNGVR